MSRIRDSNGLIVASWCLTRNRERDVIISTLTSCPRPASLALYTVHGTVHNSTGRCTHPLSVRRGPQTWQHPPSSLHLYQTCQWHKIQDLFSRHKLWCMCQGTEWASRGLALQVPGSASLNMWLLTRCSINTGRETSHDVDIWIILRFVCATQISCYYRSSLLFLGHIMNNESIHFSARQFKMFPSSRNIKCFMKWKKVTKISQVVLIIFVRLLKSFYK